MIEKAKTQAKNIINRAQNKAHKQNENMTKRKENQLKKLQEQLEKAKKQQKNIIQKAKNQRNNIIERAKVQKNKIIEGGKTKRNNIIEKAKQRQQKMIENQQKRIKQKVARTDMMLKRKKKLFMMKLKRKNHSNAQRPQIAVDPIPEQPNVIPPPPAVVNSNNFEICASTMRGYFSKVQSMVHSDIEIDFKYESSPECEMLPESTIMKQGECFDILLNMFSVLSKEVKVYLDPKSITDYDSITSNIDMYADFIRETATNCGAKVVSQENEQTFSPVCQSSHINAFSKFNETSMSDMPFMKYQQISNSLEFAISEESLNSIKVHCE
jgi:F0F1-type ATP synthase membrane subunit b/b'